MEWTEDLAVGIETIDAQHRELFVRINNLVRAIKEHRCKSEIDGTIQFLDEYARFHFTEEEKNMQSADYPEYDYHKQQHAQYLQNITELKRLAEQPRIRGVSYELSVTANQIVVDWIVDHIMKTDKKFGIFLRESQKR